MKQKGHIIWIDDEIHHLKPHILFLESKGYEPFICSTEDEARNYFLKDYKEKTWSVFRRARFSIQKSRSVVCWLVEDSRRGLAGWV